MSDHARSREGVAPRVSGTVRIVGAGLLGASIGHALMARGVDVALDDTSPSQLRLAIDYGAGRAARDDDAPVAHRGGRAAGCHRRRHRARAHPLPRRGGDGCRERQARAAPRAPRARRRPHPLHRLAPARRAASAAARSRPAPTSSSGARGSSAATRRPPASDLALVEGLALELGATPIEMTPEDHDRSVALVSHVPQLVASLLAARFVDAPDGSLGLAGQGVRDTTRIAASAPELWVQILGANAEPVVEVLDALAADLAGVADALRAPDAAGSRRAVADTIRRGNEGVERLPGKHGRTAGSSRSSSWSMTRPGQLGRLFGELGELDVNVEDLRLEHSPGAQFGLAEISVVPSAVRRAQEGLEERGWRIASTTND